MSEREAGWYWVKVQGRHEVAMLMHCGKWLTMLAGIVDGSWFDEISDRIPTPDELWQCVPVEPTREMSEAFMERHKMPYHPSGEDEYRPAHTWKAVLSAAPKPGGN